MKKCQSCGRTFEDDKKYCTACGTELIPLFTFDFPTTSNDATKCPNCTNDVVIGDRECHHCGKDLVWVDNLPELKENRKMTFSPPPSSPHQPQLKMVADLGLKLAHMWAKTMKARTLVLAIGLLLLLIIGTIVLISFLLGSQITMVVLFGIIYVIAAIFGAVGWAKTANKETDERKSAGENLRCLFLSLFWDGNWIPGIAIIGTSILIAYFMSWWVAFPTLLFFSILTCVAAEVWYANQGKRLGSLAAASIAVVPTIIIGVFFLMMLVNLPRTSKTTPTQSAPAMTTLACKTGEYGLFNQRGDRACVQVSVGSKGQPVPGGDGKFKDWGKEPVKGKGYFILPKDKISNPPPAPK